MFYPIQEDLLRRYLSDSSFMDGMLEIAATIAGGGHPLVPSEYSAPAFTDLIEKVAASKIAVKDLDGVRIAIVLSMWNEASRLPMRGEKHPIGENCLVSKLEALDWLFRGVNVDWHLFAVDDGCPVGSGDIAWHIAQSSGWSDKVTVLKLAEGFPYEFAPLNGIQSAVESVKGGAIALGGLTAVQKGYDYIAFTDCDNSVHLGQIGNLISPAIATKADLVCGERVSGKSVFFWHPDRSSENKSTYIIYHIRKLLMNRKLAISDISSPFKLFRAEYFQSVFKRLSVLDFLFDLDIALTVTGDGIAPVEIPYTCIDSFQGSTWHFHGDAKIEYQRLQSALRLARKYNMDIDPRLENIIQCKIKSPEDVHLIMTSPPPPAMNCDEGLLGKPSTMPIEQVEEWLEGLLGR